MTLTEYDTEFKTKVQEEREVFRNSIDRLVQVGGGAAVDRYIVDIYRQIETPYMALSQ